MKEARDRGHTVCWIGGHGYGKSFRVCFQGSGEPWEALCSGRWWWDLGFVLERSLWPGEGRMETERNPRGQEAG